MDVTSKNSPKSAIERYYQDLGQGVLSARKCRACQEYTFPPTGCCCRCGSWELDWVTLSGKGTLHYATHNITPACHPRFEPIAPYVYGHVRLDEGVIVQAVIQGVKASPQELGKLYERGPVPVEADILRMNDLPVLAFRLA
jgi:uncharacterized OB-fold protein